METENSETLIKLEIDVNACEENRLKQYVERNKFDSYRSALVHLLSLGETVECGNDEKRDSTGNQKPEIIKTVSTKTQLKQGRKRNGSNIDEETETKSNGKRNKIDNETALDFKEETQIAALPDDALIKIVKYLPMAQWPRLESVSRQFRRAVLGAWFGLKEIRVVDDMGVVPFAETDKSYDRLFELVLEKVLLRAPNVSSLCFDYNGEFSSLFTNKSVELLSKFENLRSVDFGGDAINLKELANFLEKSASRGLLKQLKVEQYVADCVERVRAVFDNESPIFENRPLKLEKLIFNFEGQVCGFLEVMDVSCLTTLNLSESRNIDPRRLLSLINRAKNLENLGFSFKTYDHREHLAQNKRILRAVSTLENLSTLKINELDFQVFVSGGFFSLESETVKMIRVLGQRRRLEELYLFDNVYCTDEIILAIASNMENLKVLELRPELCHSINPLVELVTKLRRLEKFALHSSMNPEIVSAIASNLIELKCLLVDYSFHELGSLKELNKLADLKELRIANAKPSVLRALQDLAPKLESLELPRCEELFDRGFIALISKMPRLRRLHLENAQVTDRSLRALVEWCPNLGDLDLTGCKNVTATGVQAVVDGCPLLKRLNASVSICKGKYI